MGAQRGIACAGTIVSASRVIESSMTGLRAAVFRYTVGTRVRHTDSDGRSYYVKKKLGSAVVSGDVVLETREGAVLLREGTFDFACDEPLEEPSSISGRVPAEVEHLCEPGMVLFGERFLGVGDSVELTATVRPSRAPTTAYETFPDGGAVVVDRTLEAMGLDPANMKTRSGTVALVALAVALAIAIGAAAVVTLI